MICFSATSVLTIFSFFNSGAMHSDSGRVTIKKPSITVPELKDYRVLTLKEICFATGIKRCGVDFITQMQGVSHRPLKITADLQRDANGYLTSCFYQIDTLIGKRYPSGVYFVHEPAAQPLNKVVLCAHARKRFDVLKVVMDYYYAKNKWPAITLLAGAGYYESVKILLECNDLINRRDFLLRTPLMCAARNNHLEIVHLLVERNADISLVDACNLNAVQHAREKKHNVIETFLNQHIQNNATTRNNDV